MREKHIRVSKEEKERLEHAHEILTDGQSTGVPIGLTIGRLADTVIESQRLATLKH